MKFDRFDPRDAKLVIAHMYIRIYCFTHWWSSRAVTRISSWGHNNFTCRDWLLSIIDCTWCVDGTYVYNVFYYRFLIFRYIQDIGRCFASTSKEDGMDRLLSDVGRNSSWCYSCFNE